MPEEADENNIDGIDVDRRSPGDIQLQQLKDNELDIAMEAAPSSAPTCPALAQDEQFKDRYFSTPDAAIDYGVFRTDKAAVRQREAPPGGQLRRRPDAELARSSAAR